MLIPHTFHHENHVYSVPGRYVLSTSDVLSLNGLCLLEGVPPETLRIASERGAMLHKCVQCYEEQEKLPRRTQAAHDRLLAYVRWKKAVDFRVCGPMERSLVYEHAGTGLLIGGTPDISVGWIPKDITIAGMLYVTGLYVVDLKTCARQSGKAKQQKLLEWRLQTQSYWDALQEDHELWASLRAAKFEGQLMRAVLHLHPQCGIEKRGEDRLGYEWHPFYMDDSEAWGAAVMMASLKLGNGHKVPRREAESSIFHRQLQASLETA